MSVILRCVPVTIMVVMLQQPRSVIQSALCALTGRCRHRREIQDPPSAGRDLTSSGGRLELRGPAA